MAEEEHVKGFVERQKAIFDFHKHITSLNTAAVLFFATVLEKFKPPANIKDTLLVVIIMAAFLLSLTTALSSMLHWTLHIGQPKDPNKHWHWLAFLAASESLIFIFGLFLIGIYVALPTLARLLKLGLNDAFGQFPPLVVLTIYEQ